MAVIEMLPENRAYFVEQFNRVAPDSARRFGTLTPVRMLHHLRYSFDTSLGNISDTPDWSKPVLRTVIRLVFFEWFTNWPGGKLKAPADWTPEETVSIDEERDSLIAKMDEFLAALEGDPQRRTVSPILGPTTIRYWARVHGVHFRHHFKQFNLLG